VTVEVFRAAAEDGSDAGAPEQAVLCITDTGMGMEPGELERIFEPYFRSAAAEASAITGTGLGMGIVRSLVDEHHGDLVVTSAPGRGTVATVSLPLDGDADAGLLPTRSEKATRETTDA
jgi:two-component system phosphate regulon sensor histidine kinase PhoR